MNKAKAQTLACAIAGVTITWFINHPMGYGAIVANGMVGLVAAVLLPAPLAGAAYAASFVGMSSLGVLPSIFAALVGGVVVGLVLIITPEIYAGIGGKGGTTAALSAQITRAIMNLLS